MKSYLKATWAHLLVLVMVIVASLFFVLYTPSVMSDEEMAKAKKDCESKGFSVAWNMYPVISMDIRGYSCKPIPEP
jgi:hypothetical protein